MGFWFSYSYWFLGLRESFLVPPITSIAPDIFRPGGGPAPRRSRAFWSRVAAAAAAAVAAAPVVGGVVGVGVGADRYVGDWGGGSVVLVMGAGARLTDGTE